MQSFSLRGAAAPPAGVTGKGQVWSQDTPPKLAQISKDLIFWRQNVAQMVFIFHKCLKMALNHSSCLCLLCAGITAAYPHVLDLGIKSRALCMLGKRSAS